MTSLYCLAIDRSETEDLAFTLDLEKAIEWLGRRNSRQIIEYIVSDKSVTYVWKSLRYYVDGILQHDIID